MEKTEQTDKPVKQGFWNWIGKIFSNNRDLDSTGLLVIIGGGAILHQVFCFVDSTYAATVAATENGQLYSHAINSMVLYFFMKGKSGDTITEKDTK